MPSLAETIWITEQVGTHPGPAEGRERQKLALGRHSDVFRVWRGSWWLRGVPGPRHGPTSSRSHRAVAGRRAVAAGVDGARTAVPCADRQLAGPGHRCGAV